MKKIMRLFIVIICVLIILGTAFYMVDSARVHNDQEPQFAFLHKMLDGVSASAKVDIGLGYKIMRISHIGGQKEIRIGTIFMNESLPIMPEGELQDTSIEESGEEMLDKVELKTTFGEAYKSMISIEGMEEEIDAKKITSKLGYSMDFFFDKFEYTGFEDYDTYLWTLSSGDTKAIMTISVTDEEKNTKTLSDLTKDKYEKVESQIDTYLKKYKASDKSKSDMVKYVYILKENEIPRFKIEAQYLLEAEEGIGIYIRNMINSIEF